MGGVGRAGRQRTRSAPVRVVDAELARRRSTLAWPWTGGDPVRGGAARPGRTTGRRWPQLRAHAGQNKQTKRLWPTDSRPVLGSDIQRQFVDRAKANFTGRTTQDIDAAHLLRPQSPSPRSGRHQVQGPTATRSVLLSRAWRTANSSSPPAWPDPVVNTSAPQRYGGHGNLNAGELACSAPACCADGDAPSSPRRSPCPGQGASLSLLTKRTAATGSRNHLRYIQPATGRQLPSQTYRRGSALTGACPCPGRSRRRAGAGQTRWPGPEALQELLNGPTRMTVPIWRCGPAGAVGYGRNPQLKAAAGRAAANDFRYSWLLLDPTPISLRRCARFRVIQVPEGRQADDLDG